MTADHTLQINRKPRRLEFAISPTKQTPAPQINRQQIATSTIAPFASRMPLRDTNYSSHNTSAPRIAAALLDTNGRFHRNNNSRNSFKTNERANSYSIQTETSRVAKITAKSEEHSQEWLCHAQSVLPLFLVPNRCITSCGARKIVLGRIKIRKILLASLVCLLLCGIVASEFPELLTLTDNTSNDFTVRNTSTAGLRALPEAQRPVRIADINSTVPAAILLHSRLIALEKSAPVPSELFILHSILRT